MDEISHKKDLGHYVVHVEYQKPYTALCGWSYEHKHSYKIQRKN